MIIDHPLFHLDTFILSTTMALNILHLDGTHNEHDSFIAKYLETNFNNVPINPILVAMTTMLQQDNNLGKPNVVDFVNSKIVEEANTGTSVVKNRKRLALFLMLKNFPEMWHQISNAAYNLLCGLLKLVHDSNATIFPPKWSSAIFTLENRLKPSNVTLVLFGIDPISKHGSLKNHATGYAFCFDVPDDYHAGEINSTDGLQGVYGLTRDISLIKAQSLDYRFTPYGIALINFMRTIVAGDNAGSNNRFRHAWIDYNLAWLTFLKSIKNDVLVPVLIFQGGGQYVFNNYAETAEFQNVKNMLTHVPRCAHPSYLKKKPGHCLLKPDACAQYVTNNFCNESVKTFKTVMEEIGAGELVQCPCAICVKEQAAAGPDVNEMLDAFLNIGLNE